MTRTMLFGFLLAVAALARGEEPPLPRLPFDCGGHKAYLIPAPQPAKGRPWVWYAPTLGGGLPHSGHLRWYFERFLKAGISVAGVDLGEVRGSPSSTAQFEAFHADMVKRGYSSKPILLGQSRGGMMMLAFAMRHPDQLSAFVGIYPVCNLASWPLKNSKAATLADYGLSEAELMANLARYNTLDNLQGMLAAKIPMFLVHGDSDVVVPLADNGALLKQRYEAGGGSVAIKVIPGEGHRVSDSFFQCPELLEFVLARTGS